MIIFALVIGLYSYFIFTLGIFSFLYPGILSGSFVLLLFVCWVIKRRSIKHFFISVYQDNKKSKISVILLVLLLLQIGVNTIGMFGPELGFDALWYHLTLPKLYLLHHSIFHIPGGLLYYTDMPKLGEMLYTAGLSFGEGMPKLIHFSFGILTICLLYQILRTFVSPFVSLIGLLMFYTSLVVGWESTSAYIDLIRTFYELMGFWLFLRWRDKKEQKLLLLSAIMLGFAITTKLLALGSVAIFLLLIIYDGIVTKERKHILRRMLLFSTLALVIPLPWFVFAYSNTGNPLYPFFTSLYAVTPQSNFFSPLIMIKEFVTLFLFSSDPISPVYLICLPVVFISYRIQKTYNKTIYIYSFLVLIVWYITPRTGGGRFILPYLPTLSIVAGVSITPFLKQKSYRYIIITVLLFVVLTSVIYRGGANAKYIPYLLGKESKPMFLKNHLNFNYGDFYDVDGFFKNTISKNDQVLFYGFHNLYYVDFPFIDNSWVKKGDAFNYIAVQNNSLSKRFRTWKKIYTNPLTKVSVYTNNKKMVKY
ncbi:hypothetical protein BH11PAT1_BH11PAT1_7330 [soil metagenome]